MSRSTDHQELFLNDGAGRNVPIQTGTFITKAINLEERRRLSVTLGIQGATASGTIVPLGNVFTGVYIPTGGFTGTFLVQGTNEMSYGYGVTGTNYAFSASTQPGDNGSTGALFWNTLAGGTVNITQQITSAQLDFTDIGCSYIRFAFNNGTFSGTSAPAGTSQGGSGTFRLFYTTKHT